MNNKTKSSFLGGLFAVLFGLLAALAALALLPSQSRRAAAAATHSFTHAAATAISADGGSLAPGYYYLDGDVTLAHNITIDAAAVEICLNGHVLCGNGEFPQGSVITVTNGGSLTLCDCNGSAHNTITVDGEQKTYDGGIITGGHGTWTGSILSGGGVYVPDNSSFTLDGGTIAGNTILAPSHIPASYGVRGGGVYGGSGSTITIHGGAITDNSAMLPSNNDGLYDNDMFGGGGVYVGSGTFIMTDGEIRGNKAARGGGVFIRGADSCEMSGGEIRDNTAKISGGGAEIRSSDNAFKLSGGAISENTVSNTYGHGGGVSFRGKFDQTGGEIRGNKAARGSGVYIECTVNSADGLYTMTGGAVKGNIGQNGAIFMDSEDDDGNECYPKLIISGNIDISGNTDNDGKPCNVYLNDYLNAVRVNGQVTSPVKIGITISDGYYDPYGDNDSKYKITDGYSSDQDPDDIFASDRKGGVFYMYEDPMTDVEEVFLSFAVAKVEYNGTTQMFSALNDAFDYANAQYAPSGASAVRVTLLADTQLSGRADCTTNIIFDLNGHIVSRAPTYSGILLYVGPYGNTSFSFQPLLNIIDSDPNNAHYYTTPYGSPVFDDDVQTGDGVQTISGGLITGSSYQYAVSMGTYTKLVIDGGTIFANIGGGIQACNGGVDLYINGGSIIANGSDELARGGGIFLCGQTCEINGGRISENRAQQGGGIYAGSDITVNGGEISYNAADVGGGIYADSSYCVVYLNGGSIENNEARNAGGIYINKDIRLGGAPKVTDNYAQASGGAKLANNLYIAQNGIAKFSGALSVGAQIGVTLADDFPADAFTDGYGASNSADGVAIEPHRFFMSDDPALIACLTSGGEVRLAAKRKVTIAVNNADYGATDSGDFYTYDQASVYIDGNALTIADKTITATVKTMNGYILTFDRWTVVADGGSASAVSALSTDVTATAHFTATPVTLTQITATDVKIGAYKAYDGAQLAVTAKFSDNSTATLTVDDYTVTYPDGQGGKLYAGSNALTVAYTFTDASGQAQTRTCSVNIDNVAKLVYDASQIVFDDASIVYDGQTHSLEAVGLPNGVSVTYQGNDVSEVGVHTVTATFTGDANYESIPDKTATLTITAAAAESGGGIPWYVWLIIALAVAIIAVIIFVIVRRKKTQQSHQA